MKKIFPLVSPTHASERVVEQVKHEVRKYIKRERRKALPEDADFWAFDCKVGQNESDPKPQHIEEVIPAIDAAAREGCSAVYVEILARPANRTSKRTE